ncbi:MAG: 4Fe-4S binding protein, partial [Oscillospiraceae bacterium]|nr:4Fe-4S binding protein [Oscillospiraceae bacterium]
VKDVVAFVACNGHCEATSIIAQYEGVQTCRAASMLYGGTNSCRFGCLGLGDCANACPSNAICMADGIAHVDTSRCVGCELCKQTCPKGIITMLPQEATAAVMCSNRQKGADARKVCTNACIGCKKCEKSCPSGAIVVTDNLAVIDYNKCTYCGHCISECPTGCLKKVYFPDLPEDYDPKTLAE